MVVEWLNVLLDCACLVAPLGLGGHQKVKNTQATIQGPSALLGR